MSPDSDEKTNALAEFEEARGEWSQAVRGHRLAPPDAGFSTRLAALARAAARNAKACEAAHKAGFAWPPATRASAIPYELQPGTGRRGPPDLWLNFDRAVEELNRVSESRSLLAVARAYADLARAADDLARAIAAEDRASIPPDQVTRAQAG